MPTFPSQQDHALNQPRAPSFLQQNQQQLHRSLSSQNIKSMHQYSFYQQEKSRSRNSSQEHLSKGFYHKGDENYETTSMPDSLSRLAQPHSIDTDSLLMQPSPIEQYHGQIAEFMAKMGQVLERARLPSITFSPALGSSQDDGIPRGILSKTSSFSNLSSFNTRENYAAETLSYAIPDKAGSMTAEPTLSRRIDFSSILSQEEYWKSGLPLFIDILCQESILLERWVMSFEAQTPSPSSEEGEGPRFDETELILLVQSIYSQMRLLPVGTALSSGTVTKDMLTHSMTMADGQLVSPMRSDSPPMAWGTVSVPLDSSETPLKTQTGFHKDAKLSVQKFRPGITSFGVLRVSVVYESDVSRVIFLATGSEFQGVIGVSLTEQPVTSIVDSSRDHEDKAMSSELEHEKNVEELDTRRAGSGSPLPSPSMQRRALGYANRKLSYTTGSPSTSTANIDPVLLEKNLFRARASLTRPPSHRSSLSYAMSRQSTASSSEELSLNSDDESETDDKKQTLLKPIPTRPPFPGTLSALPDEEENQNLLERNDLQTQLSRSFDAAVSIGHIHTRSSPVSSRNASFAVPYSGTLNSNATAELSQRPRRISLPSKVNTTGFRGYDGLRSAAPTPSSELFGSFVGSYEQSILNGRMSTLPSKPITFVAEIGVIGIGKCKSSLKCPPHLVVEFPAYFYELQDDVSPATPYVGSIEVDWALAIRDGHGSSSAGPSDDKSAKNSRPQLDVYEEKQLPKSDSNGTGTLPRFSSKDLSKKLKQEYVGYRIPPKGQLQIVIKNPSRLAIKVFLVPYDLRDMPANTKTFLRQKSYVQTTTLGPSMSRKATTGVPSNQPISSRVSSVISPPESITNSSLVTEPEQTTKSPASTPATSSSRRSSLSTSSTVSSGTQDRLRYALQLQIHCTAKKHLFLCKNMRIVFSHRALDTDEKLKVVLEGPSNPKYMPLDASTPLISSAEILSRSPKSTRTHHLDTVSERGSTTSMDSSAVPIQRSSVTSGVNIEIPSFSGTTPPSNTTVPEVGDEKEPSFETRYGYR